MTTTASHPQTLTRRSALLIESGLGILSSLLTFNGHEYDLEDVDRNRDIALTIYLADDTVYVIKGWGRFRRYDVARYTNREWDLIDGQPFKREDQLTTRDVLDVLDGTRDLPNV